MDDWLANLHQFGIARIERRHWLTADDGSSGAGAGSGAPAVAAGDVGAGAADAAAAAAAAAAVNAGTGAAADAGGGVQVVDPATLSAAVKAALDAQTAGAAAADGKAGGGANTGDGDGDGKPAESAGKPSEGDGKPAAKGDGAEVGDRLAKLEKSSEDKDKRLSRQEDAMRREVLKGLQVKPKFAEFAPKFDPFTDAGRAAAETWASENPELLVTAQTGAAKTDPVDMKTLLGDGPNIHLVDPVSYAEQMAKIPKITF